VKIPPEALSAIEAARARQASQDEARAERDGLRAVQDAERRERGRAAAAVVLRWARELAASVELPARGLRLGAMLVHRDGTIELGLSRHGIGGVRMGATPDELADAPLDVLEHFARAIESGAIWSLID
jgi:hypothetical protein